MQRRILVVDDSTINRQILRRILSDEYEVIEAENGREALDLLAEERGRVAAILLDIVMPVMNGYDMLAELRQTDALAAIPVIVTTGNTEGDSEIRALTLGANDFVTKPYNAGVIKRRLKNLINLRETAATVNALTRDKLTGLYGREAFFDKAAELIAQQPDGYYIAAAFNVSGFKILNDQYGSEKGNEVLKRIAAAFQTGFGALGGLCCRVTADHFAVLYPSRYKNSQELADIRAAASKPPNAAMPPIAFSVGRYTVTDRTLSVSAMYDRAAIAESSVRGRYDTNIAEYDEAMRDTLLYEQRIVNDMNDALAGNQFEVWYQPQYNHFSGALIGAEALVRWRHPKYGLIPPGKFIPVFERNGFIYELDKFVWERVCAALRAWLDEGREPLPVSVNISRYDVFRPDLIATVTGLVERYRLPASMLRVEITESAFATSPQQIVAVVKDLIRHGFTVEIDDFGSGYSSLNTLKDVPAQTIKLDVRFLESSDDSQRGGNIIESVVRMAKWLGMSVIAEGVETAAQADYLKSIGCNYVQGYLYARPMPHAEYDALASASLREEKVIELQTVENLNNNAFWDPDSMDTLIFNSYIGCACIFEYCDDRIELLRATEKYARMIGSAGMTIADALKLDWTAHLDAAGRAALREAVERSARAKDEVTGEFVFHDLPGCPKDTHLRSTLRVIATTGDRSLIYCTNENITAQREAERKERELAVQLEAIMANISCGLCATETDGQGGVRVLFANGAYYAMLGYTREQLERELGSPLKAIHPDDVAAAMERVQEVYDTGKSVTHVYRCVRRDGSVIWERCINSLTTVEGREEPILLAAIDDITGEVLANERLRETDDQLRYLNDVSRRLLASGDADEAVRDVLSESLAFFEAGRAYILELDEKQENIRNTYEVCAEGVPSRMEYLRDVPGEVVPFWLEAMERDEPVIIPDVSALRGARAGEREMLERQGIRSLAAVALKRDGRPIGAIGVDDPKRRVTDVNHLRAIGDYAAVILTRRALNAKIASDQQNILGLMHDTPGGFMRMRVQPDGELQPVYANEGLCGMLGMTRDEFISHYDGGAMWGVHPDDRAMLRESTQRLLATGETRGAKYRMRHVDGHYVWVNVFGRVARDDAGDRYLNVYYAEASEKEKRDLTMRETTPFVLQAIMQSSNDLAFAKDKDLRYICCSPAFARFAGQRDESGVVGRTDFSLFPQKTAEQFRRDDLKLFAGGKPLIDYLEPIPSTDSVAHYSNTSKYILRDAEGEIIGLYGVGRDVTQARAASEQLSLLADSIPGGLATYAVGPDDIKLLYFNDGYCRIMGCTHEQYARIASRGYATITYEDDLPALRAQIDRLLEKDTPIDCTYRVRNVAEDRLKWVNLRSSHGDRRGDITYVHVVLYDIDDAKRAEEALRQSREEMELSNRLVDESSSAVYVCDAETYQMLYLNQRCARMCGKTVEQARGATCYAYLKNLDKPCAECYMRYAVDDRYTERVYDSPATGRHYLARGRFIDWGGRRALVEYLSDETERIAMQRQLEANAARSQFLSRMSHDMRTPMNAVIGMAELAKSEKDPAVVAEYLDNIDASGHFLLGLINDVLDLNNIESGKINLREEPFHKSEFVRGVLAVIRPLIKGRKQRFALDLSEAPECVVADKLRCVQIFYNLLVNASKFTPEGGRLELSCRRIPDRDGKRGTRFFVRDNGAGMSEEFQQVMYEPFAQEPDVERGDQQGTGLGLAIVKNLVDAMGGEIHVKSRRGEGTEFAVDLYMREVSGAREPAPNDGRALAGLRVLLAEDNPLNVIVAQRLLENKGCEVTVALNGREAVERFKASPEGHFGATLMDLRMPVMDGYEATRLIRASGRADAETMPIIAMTADAFDGDRERTQEAGMNAHIVKPVDKHLLFDTLARLCKR